MRRTRALPALVLIAAGCAATGPEPGPAPDPLAGTRWQLVEVGGVPAAGEAWIAFERGGRAGGRSGCNHFGGDYSYADGALSFGNMAMTQMGCEGPAMEVEARLAGAFGATAAADIVADRLVLLDAGGAPLASFVRTAAG